MKLYVLIKKDLTPSQKAVQAGHAVSIYASRHPEINWFETHFVYLDVTHFQMAKLLNQLQLDDIEYAQFQEPDLGNKTTAVACMSNGNMFRRFNLV